MGKDKFTVRGTKWLFLYPIGHSKAAEAAVPLSNWLRTLQLPQLTRDCSQMCNKIQFGLVLCKDVLTLNWIEFFKNIIFINTSIRNDILVKHGRSSLFFEHF